MVNKKQLKYGVYSSKVEYIQKTFISIYIIVQLLLVTICQLAFKKPFIAFIFIPLFLIPFFIYMVKSNPLSKLIKYGNDLEIKKYDELLNKIKKETLNQESKNVIKIIEANYISDKDINRFKEIFESITYPLDQNYIQVYNSLSIVYNTLKKDYDKAKEIDETNHLNSSLFYNIYLKDDVVDLSLFKQSDIKRVNITNNFLKMIYFYKHSNIKKAKEIANTLKDLPLDHYKNIANEILNDKFNIKHLYF